MDYITYVAIIKKHWWSKRIKIEYSFKENAVDQCRQGIRKGYWCKIKTKKNHSCR